MLKSRQFLITRRFGSPSHHPVLAATLAADLDPSILDPSHTTKVGLQATLISNHTHPAHVVLGKGSILEPGIHSTATITLTVVSLHPLHVNTPKLSLNIMFSDELFLHSVTVFCS